MYVACGFLDDDKNIFDFGLYSGAGRVFDLASLTKALVTTPLVLWACQKKGKDPSNITVSQLFGDVATDHVGASNQNHTVASYLRHETGLPAWRNFYTACKDGAGEFRQTLKEVLFRCPQGDCAKDVYSDVGFLTLGALLREASNQPILSQWQRMCGEFRARTEGLGSGQDFASDEVISTGFCPVRERVLWGEVHDENCWALGGFCGHAGLFGSGRGVTDYLRSLWQTGAGRAVFEENFRQLSSRGDSLMGWRKGQDASSKTFADGRGCGHMGFTGTAFWVDPVTRSYAVVLTNRVISGRVSADIKNFRAEAFKQLWDLLPK